MSLPFLPLPSLPPLSSLAASYYCMLRECGMMLERNHFRALRRKGAMACKAAYFRTGCELSEKSKGNQSEESSIPSPLFPSLSSVPSTPRRVRCAISKGVGAHSRGFNPPGNSHTVLGHNVVRTAIERTRIAYCADP
jgi:hypothetical protein